MSFRNLRQYHNRVSTLTSHVLAVLARVSGLAWVSRTKPYLWASRRIRGLTPQYRYLLIRIAIGIAITIGILSADKEYLAEILGRDIPDLTLPILAAVFCVLYGLFVAARPLVRNTRGYQLLFSTVIGIIAGGAIAALVLIPGQFDGNSAKLDLVPRILGMAQSIPVLVPVGLMFVFITLIRPFESFLFWIIVAPLFQRFRGLDFAASMPAVTFDRAALTLVLVSVIMQKLSNRKTTKGKIESVDFAIGAFLLVSVFSLVLARPVVGPLVNLYHMPSTLVNAMQTFGDHYLFAFIVFYLVRNLVDTPKKIDKLLLSIASISLYLVPIGLFERVTGKSWFTGEGQVWYKEADMYRAAGPFTNPAVYGAVLGICFLIIIYLLFKNSNSFKRGLYGLCAMSAGVGIVASLTRSAWLSPIVGFLALIFLYEGKRTKLLAWLLAGVVVLVCTAPIIMKTEVYKKRITQQAPLDYRIYASRVSFKMIKDKPLFGHGIGNFDYYTREYPVYIAGVDTTNPPASHNTFLTIFVETGILGFLPYMSALFIIARRLFIAYKYGNRRISPTARPLLAVVAAALVCYLVTALTIDMRFFRYVEYIFWGILGIVCVQYELVMEDMRRKSSLVSTLPSADELECVIV